MKGKRTRPAVVELLPEEPWVYPRPVPIRFRKSVPTAWLKMEISEGMNRQIRRMTAQVGPPYLASDSSCGWINPVGDIGSRGMACAESWRNAGFVEASFKTLEWEG